MLGRLQLKKKIGVHSSRISALLWLCWIGWNCIFSNIVWWIFATSFVLQKWWNTKWSCWHFHPIRIVLAQSDLICLIVWHRFSHNFAFNFVIMLLDLWNLRWIVQSHCFFCTIWFDFVEWDEQSCDFAIAFNVAMLFKIVWSIFATSLVL